jgi:hypothetical protein
MTDEERDTVVAGLRLLQERMIRCDVSDDIENIATCGDTHPM